MSVHNGVIDWEAARSAGVGSAYIRATMGAAGVDTSFRTNTHEAALWGVRIGFYHLFRADASGIKQAQHALSTLAGIYVDYELAIDVEAAASDVQITPTEYANQLAAFIEEYRRAKGRLPVIYTGYGAWTGLVAPNTPHNALFSQCQLWVANYTTADEPLLPPIWGTWWLWQYTSSGYIDGFPGRVDMNRVNA